MPTLPTDAALRKLIPLDAVFDFFPAALAEVARCIKVGADQHCEGRLEWDRSKSTDHIACWLRHNIDRRDSDLDSDEVLHLAKMAWRSLAVLQLYMEAHGKPVAPAAVNEGRGLEFKIIADPNVDPNHIKWVLK